MGYRAAGSLPIGLHYGGPRPPSGPVSLGSHSVVVNVPPASFCFFSMLVALGAGDGSTTDGKLSIAGATGNGPPSINSFQIDSTLFVPPFAGTFETLFGNPAPNRTLNQPFGGLVVYPVEWLDPVPAAYDYEAMVTGTAGQVLPNCPLATWRPLRHQGFIRNSVGFATQSVSLGAPGPILAGLQIRDPATLQVLATGTFSLEMVVGP